MPFEIPEFMANLNAQGGVLRNNKFLCIIPMSPGQAGITQAEMTTMQFFCEAANIPAAALATADIRRYGYGPMEKKPYAPLFTDVNLSFICDAKATTWNFFYKWINFINNFRFVPDQKGDSGGGLTQPTNKSKALPYELQYKDAYVSPVSLFVLDQTAPQTPNIGIVLRDAYPTFLGELPLNWGSKDDYIKVPVTLTFIDWFSAYPIPAITGS
jgi:hypothetical protein